MLSLRYAWRSLAKSPGFVAIAVLALGLGLGLSTTMFAVMDAVLNPYVAYRDPQTLFTIRWWFGRNQPMRPPELYRWLRDNTHSFADVAPVAWGGSASIERPGADPITLGVGGVTPRWLAMTGVRPRLGRTFTAADGPDVIILSDQLFRRLFGRRRGLENLTVTINDRVIQIVGVLPRGFRFGDAIRPIPGDVETGSVTTFVQPWVRLKPGVTKDEANEELKALANQLSERYDARQNPFSFELGDVVDRREEIRDIHKAMIGAALAVLIIACVNLAHLMMTRGLAKRRELALRMALGATRGAVVRQMFTECVFITLAGMAVGGLVAYWMSDVLQNRMPPEVGWVGLVQPQLSWRVFASGALAAALSAVLFGLLPALKVAFALNLDDPLKDDSGTTTGRVRYRYNPLVMVEVGLALVLLMGGGLLVRTVLTLQREMADINEDTLWRGVVYARRGDTSSSRVTLPSRRALEMAITGVSGVAAVAFEADRATRGGAISGERTDDSTNSITMRSVPLVSENYLDVLGLPVIRGRNFMPGDGAAGGVAIIDAVAAERLYHGLDPVGRMLKLGQPWVDAPWVRIVGVARSRRVRDGVERYIPQPRVYLPLPDSARSSEFLLRTTSTSPAAATRVTAALRALGPFGVGTWPMAWQHRGEMASRGFLAKVFVTLGIVALGLAALGLYGVLAYAVTRRMREFAVRVALGADPKSLRTMVLHDGFVMLLAGIGVGAFFALLASRLLDAVLIAILPSDVISLVISEVILIGAGLAAALGPARRAARANPMDILRAV